jgi:hypothetical protein
MSMASSVDLGRIEADAYRSRFDDGLIDLFLGISLVWVGASWLWLEGIAAFAGLVPALAVVPFLEARRRFLERRAGHVRFADRRRRWERRTLAWLVLAGAVLAGVAMVLIALDLGDSDIAAGPGVIALLLAVLSLGLAWLTTSLRFAAYGAVLVVAGTIAALTDANPGLPVLVGGMVATMWGAVVLIRFVGNHPADTAVRDDAS